MRKDSCSQADRQEAATPSRAWKLLSASKPETILFLDTTTRNQTAANKIKNFFGKWRQLKQRIPLPEMTELRITPDLPIFPSWRKMSSCFCYIGKLRSRTETINFLSRSSRPRRLRRLRHR